MSCSVCLEAFTEKQKKPVSCPYCNVAACLQCAKRCCLIWSSGPKCASCNKAFTNETVDSMFTRGFRRGQLRISAIQSLQEQEMSLLPQTMLVIEAQNNEAKMNSYTAAMRQLCSALLSEPKADFDFEKLADLQKLIRQLPDSAALVKRASERHLRSVKCPLNAGTPSACMGYIINSCGICGTKVCKECNEILLPEHACSPENVASWTAIKESSVGCPKCGTQIQKVSGCNQMWCTVANCNTAFDWSTGRIINGPIHNPHYHDFLRNAGGLNVGPHDMDIACQGPRGIISNQRVFEINDILDTRGLDIPRRNHLSFSQEEREKNPQTFMVHEIMRALLESVDPYYAPTMPVEYTPNTHQDLRIKFLKKEITKTQWASRMSCRETHRTKNRKVFDLHQMFQTAGADIFARFYTDIKAFAALHGRPTLKRRDIQINRAQGLELQHTSETRTVNTLTYTAAAPLVDSFIGSINALREYYARQTWRILSDYTVSTARILHSQNGHLSWSILPVAALKEYTA